MSFGCAKFSKIADDSKSLSFSHYRLTPFDMTPRGEFHFWRHQPFHFIKIDENGIASRSTRMELRSMYAALGGPISALGILCAAELSQTASPDGTQRRAVGLTY